jgi:hypothetical protein
MLIFKDDFWLNISDSERWKDNILLFSKNLFFYHRQNQEFKQLKLDFKYSEWEYKSYMRFDQISVI